MGVVLSDVRQCAMGVALLTSQGNGCGLNDVRG